MKTAPARCPGCEGTVLPWDERAPDRPGWHRLCDVRDRALVCGACGEAHRWPHDGTCLL